MPLTNRQLYELVTSFESDRELEEYLRALWSLGREHRDQEMNAEVAAELLGAALDAEAPAADPAWMGRYAAAPEPGGPDFSAWEDTILFQIVDLRRMDAEGILTDPERYFGVTSPSGARWYNFDPVTYLECAVRGSVGGYDPEEAVVLVADGGSVRSANTDGDPDVFELDEFGWDAFADLLWFGQYYE